MQISQVLKLSEQSDAVKFQSEEAVLDQMKGAAKMICESVFMAPALGRSLFESFSGVFPVDKTSYTQQHLAIYADLEADLLEWMLEHGEHWHGMWEGEDYPFESLYIGTVKGLIDAGAMVEDEQFRLRVLRILGKLRDSKEQLRLAADIVGYCLRDPLEVATDEDVRLVEDVRDVVSQGGKYNCQPTVWLYVQMNLSNVYFKTGRYDETDAAAVQTLREVAEVRQADESMGKWAPRQNRDVALYMAHLAVMVESDAYLKRAAVCNHFLKRKKVMEYLDQAEAVLDREESTDRRFPELRQQILYLRCETQKLYPDLLNPA